LNARTRLTASVAVVGAAVLVLSACSSSNKTSSSPTPTASGSGGALTIGTLLPQTGSLAFLGPPEIAGVQLAIKDINNAGGVNGSPVTLEQSDSGDTTTNIASQSVDSLLAKNVSAIIGAASSSVSCRSSTRSPRLVSFSSRQPTPHRS
jgi:branched-chain amino acid transport system substrate-binding protein